jgi:ankyrin repeat protein
LFKHAAVNRPSLLALTQFRFKDRSAMKAAAKQSHAELVNLFLENACADPLLANGPAAHSRRSHTAHRILKHHPEIARENIHTAVVCGDIQEVERILSTEPAAATEPGGPQRRRHLKEREKLWTPLLHLCYGRLPLLVSENAVAIARLLLDHGADANDFFECGDHPNRYTTLCGVAGEGEDDAPPHPQREKLARLLLERGANPYDGQLFYNTHFHNEILWILKLVYEYSVKAGHQADWDDPNWSMLDMGGYGCGARYFLGNAISHNNIELVEWLLKHGASPDAPPSTHPRVSKAPLHEEALRLHHTEIADLLLRYGARPSPPIVRTGIEEFTEICFALDREKAGKLVVEHPGYLLSTAPIFAAAKRDRADVVELLLDLGVSIEIEDEKRQRPLHIAATHESIAVAKILIDRGADLEAVESNWDNTPLDFALYGNLPRMTQLLSDVSNDVFRLTWCGNLERLRHVLNVKPNLAKSVDDGTTPLMWLPDDEALAVEAVELLMSHGADPSIQSKEGKTAADYAELRALYEAAERLREASAI